MLKSKSKQNTPSISSLEEGRNEAISTGFVFHNIECKEATGGLGCDLAWCRYTPAIQVWQFILSLTIAAVAITYTNGIVIGIFSKVIGPRPQVCPRVKLCT